MKKSMLALAALTAFAGAASAQSTVTLFGVVDAALGRVSANGKSVTGISNSGINSSRVGFRGEEDLGGGLKAGFWLEGQVHNDVGQGVSQTAGYNFQRRSTLSLMGGWGEIRVGRDYTPAFINVNTYDAFGTNGVATTQLFNMLVPAGGNAAANNTRAVRADNTVAYFTPAMGGLFATVQIGFGENLSGGTKANNNLGFRAGYAAGPLSAHVAYNKAEGAETATDKSSNDLKHTDFGVSYDLGVAKIQGMWAQEKAGAAKINGLQGTVIAPLGAGELRVQFARYDLKDSDNDWNKIGLGYVHNLSKRTALYAQYARTSNKGAQNQSVSNNGLSAGAAAAGGSSNGYEFGVRHFF